MGFFGVLRRAAEKVVDGIGSAIEKGAELIERGANKVKAATTNVWNKFTGKDKFEKAKQLYEDISRKYNEKQTQFQAELDKYIAKIEAHINVINSSKERIKTDLFVQMAKKMANIKDINISEKFTVEEFLPNEVSFDSIRTKSQLFKIDFDKHKFKTTFQAIYTLGFYTRKKAKETLLNVEEEQKKLETEMKKMDAELVRLKLIEESLSNVEYYFTSLIELYETMLVRLDGSVNYLYVRCMSFAHKLVHAEMSIRKLPKMQQKEIEAMITTSKILKAMTDMQIVAIENDKEVSKYTADMKKQHEQIQKVYQAA
ncbi:MAG: hypothetical protein ACLRLP_01260 [Lachnospira sp.]